MREAQQHDVALRLARSPRSPAIRLAPAAGYIATRYLQHGGDIVRLSIVLGHTQITTTQRYLHMVTSDLQPPHQRLFSRLR